MNPDLIAAIVAWLRANSAVVSALGENQSLPNMTKIWSDRPEGQPDLPYLVILEPDAESRTHQSIDWSGTIFAMCRSHVRMHFATSGKTQARSLMKLIASSLDDAPLSFSDGTLLYLRSEDSYAPNYNELPPLAPNAYERVLPFLYVVERAMNS
jgi:hypothetical protein